MINISNNFNIRDELYYYDLYVLMTPWTGVLKINHLNLTCDYQD